MVGYRKQLIKKQRAPRINGERKDLKEAMFKGIFTVETKIIHQDVLAPMTEPTKARSVGDGTVPNLRLPTFRRLRDRLSAKLSDRVLEARVGIIDLRRHPQDRVLANEEVPPG